MLTWPKDSKWAGIFNHTSVWWGGWCHFIRHGLFLQWCPNMWPYLHFLSILPVSNIMLHTRESEKKSYSQTKSLSTLMIFSESLKGGVLQRKDGAIHLKNSHPLEETSGIHNHDSLLGLGWFLRLLRVWNDKVSSRLRLLEENSQLDLNLLGPERRDVWGGNGQHISIKI